MKQKHFIKNWLIIFMFWAMLLLLIATLTGCTEGVRPKAIQLHPEFGECLMIVPKGNKIGSHVAPENGVYMTEEVFKQMVRELLQKQDKNSFI